MKNEILFERVKKLVATERRIGVEILECLHEIDRRRAYAELRYDGLFTYCLRELGFTESQAFQRIQAMRALKDVPELKPLIEAGALSVSAISKVQTHVRKERKEGKLVSMSEKKDLFLAMENCTSREVDLKLSEVRGEILKEKLVLEMDEELSALWKRVKDLAAHRSKGDAAEAFKIIAQEWVERHDPVMRREKAVRGHGTHSHAVSVGGGPQTTVSKPEKAPSRRNVSRLIKLRTDSHRSSQAREIRTRVDEMKAPHLSHRIAPENRYIPSAGLRREVWKNDGGKCTRCDSTHALEIDHILPFSCGGETTLDNLRLLCRSCHQFLTAKTFGAVARSERRA